MHVARVETLLEASYEVVSYHKLCKRKVGHKTKQVCSVSNESLCSSIFFSTTMASPPATSGSSLSTLRARELYRYWSFYGDRATVGIYPEGVRVPPENDGKAEEIEEKRATKKRKRKEKPNRVKKSRTAYNFFFKDELAHIRRLFEHRQQQSSRSVAETDISNDALLDRITNPNGTFNVHECRTVIGERWKTVDPQR